ncbi:cytochrome b/b6 domain-containing protein [Pseudomonas sp. NPDC090755]|uniref:cytochrome b/b6 domain-containing protein n=1 Tax=Pseudomonas sp. NPDC090755 TaxID=3364481 RepID=UPI00383BA92B
MTCEKYSTPRRWLHWCFAVVVIWAIASNFASELMQLPSSIKDTIGFINVSLTTLLISLFVLWLFYIFADSDPQEPVHGSHVAHRLAQAGHLAIYVYIAVVLVTGVLVITHTISVFMLLVMSQPFDDPQLTGFFNLIQRYSCVMFALLVAGHVAAVIIHQRSGRGLLKRTK